MINLLPTEQKHQLLYAKRNRSLLHWCMAAGIAIAGIGGMVVFGQLYIAKAEENMQNTVENTTARITSAALESSNKEYESLASGVKTVVQILQKQLLFSQLVPKIGSVLPDGAVLTGLTLTSGDVALDLQIETTSANTASQTQVNFADPKNQLFDKADIVSISCEDEGDDPYPCNLSMRALYKSDASFLFLNSLKDGS